MTPESAYWPKRLGAAGEPAPDGRVWPNCGHPFTPANTQNVGYGRLRCRLCRRELNRDYVNRRKADRLAQRKRKALNG